MTIEAWVFFVATLVLAFALRWQINRTESAYIAAVHWKRAFEQASRNYQRAADMLANTSRQDRGTVPRRPRANRAED